MKKLSIVSLLFVMLLVALSACGGNAKKEEAVNPKKEVTATEETSEEKSREISLYFASSDGMTLVEEKREVTYTDEKDIPQAALDELIKGPENKDNSPVLDKGSQILSVKITDGNADVELSEEFLSLNTGGTFKEFFAIYSITDTLTSLDGIKTVTFSINGENVTEFGSYYLDAPCEKDLSFAD